jgi:two-component system chemotaxis sensor kinase CheA
VFWRNACAAYQELDELLAAVAQHVPHPRIAERIERLKYERAVVRLKRVGDQAKALAQRLGKGKIAVEIVAGNDVRFPSERWVPFWSNFVHVVRNAIGHGLEAPEERVAKGKGPGKLTLSAVSDSQYLTIEIRDDGRGVAWERVREKARERGLAHTTQQDLIEALFADGVSTAESVNETSGRGVGMAAVRDATRAMSGNITIDSTAGAGTVVRFRFPLAATARRQGMSTHPGARPSINPIASDLAADSQERARNPATRLEGVG